MSHHRNAASLGIPPSQLGVLRSLLCIFDDVPSSKELSLGLPQINLGILSLNRSFVFLCFCVFVKTSVRAYNIY